MSRPVEAPKLRLRLEYVVPDIEEVYKLGVHPSNIVDANDLACTLPASV